MTPRPPLGMMKMSEELKEYEGKLSHVTKTLQAEQQRVAVAEGGLLDDHTLSRYTLATYIPITYTLLTYTRSIYTLPTYTLSPNTLSISPS